MAVTDAYLDHARLAADFRGCGLLNAAAELPLGHPGRELVGRHKRQVQQILQEHLSGVLPAASARTTALHVSFLLEGAMSRAGLAADLELLEAVRSLAENVVTEALATQSAQSAAASTAAAPADAASVESPRRGRER